MTEVTSAPRSIGLPDRTWQNYETMAAGRNVMVDAPEWLKDMLLKAS
jgi:hypothetical protein